MFKIGEFSKLGQVSTRRLRHYDQLGLLKPSQTDKFTGYRYYTIDQLARLHRIIALKELGLPLEQIAGLLKKENELSPETLRGMLTLRRAELEQHLRETQSQLVEVEARLHHLEQAGQPSPYEIVIKAVPAQTVASVRATVPTLAEMGYYCEALYTQLYTGLKQQGLTPLQPEVTLYHSDEFIETDVEVETAVPVAPHYLKQRFPTDMFRVQELPAADLAAALIYEGPIREITPAIFALLAHIGTHRHIPAGPLREVHLSGPVHPLAGSEPDSLVIELQIAIQRVEP
jgi:DNA-binding transcriptional MerR regulator/effector-binding domain-containing protein